MKMLTEDEVLAMLDEHPQGLTIQELMARLGRGENAVRRVLKLLRAEHLVRVCRRESNAGGGFRVVYAVGDEEDVTFSVRPARKVGPPDICRAAYESMGDNPFRTLICQVAQ